MTSRQSARTAPRRIRVRWFRVFVLLVVLAAIAEGLGSLSPESSPTPATTPPAAPAGGHHRKEHRGALGEAGGAVPDGTTLYDDQVPAVANLNPSLLGALRRAADDAAAAGVKFVVNGGWRSPAYEDQLRREAIAKYGSEAEAARWVATGTTSAHVSGDAVDVGPPAAAAWLSAHGAAYGLCQIYRNEPWHYELRAGALAHGCPAMYADAAQRTR